MGSSPGFQEKMDALDLIISVLRDHEKKLDEVSNRLGGIVNELKAKEAERGREALKGGRVTEIPTSRRMPLVTYNRWDEFKVRCEGSAITAFQVEKNTFHVYSVSDEEIFGYSESLPKDRIMVSEGEGQYSIEKKYIRSIDDLTFLISGRLRCGLNVSIEVSKTALPGRKSMFELDYSFESGKVKEFLSKELNLPRDKIVEGGITFQT